jgi:ribosome biogenesis GTPase
VALEDRTVLCSLRGSLTAAESQFTNAIAVGDSVRVQVTDGEQGMVEEVLPRRSLLARPDVFKHHRQQIVAANVDQVLVVSSWREPAIWLELIDRYLIAAARYQLPARICINKIDLAEDEGEVAEHLAPYQALGYEVVCTSVPALTGIEKLRMLLHDKTTVIAGLSGVGKSSLLTAVQPDLQLRVGSVSQWWGGKGGGHGRHTTTQATLLRLNPTTAVIDTPGIREFGLSGLSRRQLGLFFPDIAGAAESCRFNDCTHINEPGCAVQAAVRKGTVFASRFHSYRKIWETLPA